MFSVKFYQGQPVNIRHDKVLEDDCRRNFCCHLDCFGRVLAVVKNNITFWNKHTANCFRNNRLIIDQKNIDIVMSQFSSSRDSFLLIHLYILAWSCCIILSAMTSSARTCLAAPSLIAARGMPNTAEVDSS